MKSRFKFRWLMVGSIVTILFSAIAGHAVVLKSTLGGDPWTPFPGSFRLTPAFPDKASRYDMLSFKPDTGDFDALKVTGQFPYARYFGFNLYDYKEATDFAGLADYQIKTEGGNVNPFLPGGDRGALNRSYTLYLVKEGTVIPPEIADPATANILEYYEEYQGKKVEKVAFMTRVYRADEGYDLLGGAALPVVEAIKFDQTKTPVAPEVGMDLSDLQEKMDMLLFNDGIITTWEVQKMFAGDEIVFHRVSDANLFPNAHNEYIISPLEACYLNKVAVVTLKKTPTAEDTYEGGNFIGGTDVRYWSFCTGGLAETGTPACLCDDQVVKNNDGSITIVIAPYFLEATVRNAGLNFLQWGAVYKPILIHRHMMAMSTFGGKISNVPEIGRPPGEEDRNQAYMDEHRAANFMGDYAPKGYIYPILTFTRNLSNGSFHTAFE